LMGYDWLTERKERRESENPLLRANV
jgi:hypothetical protein